MDNKIELFYQLYTENIDRTGSQDLLNWLSRETTFFKDPASSKHHLDYPGGLVEHSINTYKRLKWLCRAEYKFNPHFYLPFNESIAIVGLLHDLCKVGTYELVTQRVKKYIENTEDVAIKPTFMSNIQVDSIGSYIWDTQYTYKKHDSFLFGHGEKSVYLISKFMKLTDEEALAIRWHMASWNEWEKDDASRCFSRYEFAMLTHMADEFATFVDEV